MKILVDTNAYSGLMKGDSNILSVLNKSDIVYFSVIVMGKLKAGFKGGTKEKENESILADFLAKSTVRTIDVTIQTAQIFAELKHSLKTSGTPIPINDVWIASHAIETGSQLLTYDKHFQQVSGLRLYNS